MDKTTAIKIQAKIEAVKAYRKDPIAYNMAINHLLDFLEGYVAGQLNKDHGNN